MSQTSYAIIFPDYFDEEAPILEAKGCFWDLVVHANGQTYRPNFYDPVRLMQTIDDALSSERACFSEPNVVVVRSIGRENLEAAVARLARENFSSLVPE
jgi:hypothetical protein